MAPLWVQALASVALLSIANAGCPTDWLEFRGHCYYGSNFELTWEDARQICKQMQPDSDLPSIHSLADVSFLHETYPGYRWIGLNDKSTEGTFVWSNGEAFDYSDWTCHQPDNAYDGENCGEMYKDGRFNDRVCHYENKFICQMSSQ